MKIHHVFVLSMFLEGRDKKKVNLQTEDLTLLFINRQVQKLSIRT